jgi:hypothetical protein
MTARYLIGRPSAWAPIVLSVVASAFVGWSIVTQGPDAVATEPTDEGPPARLFQLLLLVQVPIVAWFVARWVPVAPRIGLAIAALQVGAAALAVGLVIVLEAR